MRRWVVFVVASTSCTLLAGIATNWATDELPWFLEGHPGRAWALVGVLALLTIAAAVAVARSQQDNALPPSGLQAGDGPILQAAGPMHVYLDQRPPPREPRDTPPPSAERVWNIPPPVRSFTGRDQQLHHLHKQLGAGHAAALVPTAAMYGMGGIGKTQLALAYAHRYQEHYGLGWWIHAANDVEIITALGELAVELGLPVDVRPQRLVTRVHQALAGRQDWLLVFDNAEQPDALEPFVPKQGRGHVLITSRNLAWRGVADPFPVDLLSRTAAVRLLQDRTGDPDQEGAEALAEEVGRLPLALEQVAAYMVAQRQPLGRYLELFRERRSYLLAKGRPLAYEGTVDAVFTLAVDRLREQHPSAVRLLELFAVLAPDQLPVELLLSNPELLPEPLSKVAQEPERAAETIGGLYQAGLLAPDAGKTARVHRLVQEVVFHRLPHRDRRDRVEQAVELLASLFPSGGEQPQEWPACALLLPHVQSVSDHARQQQLTSPTLSRLVTKTAMHLRARGLRQAAQKVEQDVLDVNRRLHQHDHPDIAESLHRLAGDYFHLGQIGQEGQARELHEQALAMRQRLYQGDHPDIAESLIRLGSDLHRLGELRRARELFEQALAMRQRLYQGDHADVASGLSNLGSALRDLDKLDRARELHEQALAMRQRLFQGDHPHVAWNRYNLAHVLRRLGELEQARDLDAQAVAMFQRLYQRDHPDIAASLGGLAADLRELGEPEQARELDEQALSMLQSLEAGDRPEVARSLRNLATDLRELGKLGQALELDEQALAIFQRLDPGDRPDIARSLRNLAADLRALGETEQARELDDQALAMYRRLAWPQGSF